MDTVTFKVYMKTEHICTDIARDVERRSDTSNYKLHKPFLKGKKVIGLMKDELCGNVMKEFAALRVKRYNYLSDNRDEDKKQKALKKCVIKIKLKFEDYKSCVEAT